MQAVKKYLGWIIIGVVILGALGFYFVYVGGLKDKAMADHDRIASDVRAFNNFSISMSKEIPTPKDLEIGGDFLDKIFSEGKRARALWRSYGQVFEEGIVKGAVVYPETDKERAGKPVMAQFFPDFMRSNYLSVMADAENMLVQNMEEPWAQMLAQSYYARDYSLTMEQAKQQGRDSAKAVSVQEAKIFAPESMIPFKMTDNFTSPQTRVETWRQFLIFRDIMKRVVANTSAEVEREVLSFERPGVDFDPIIDKLNTKLLKGKGTRFIEQLSLLSIKKIRSGVGEIQMDKFVPDEKASEEAVDSFDASLLVDANSPKADKPKAAPVGSGVESSNVFDVYEITIEVTAHLKVLHDFISRLPKTDKMYYVSRSCEIIRLPDAVTMGNYALPQGADSTAKFLPDATFAAGQPTPIDPYLGLEHEAPVKAKLVYLLYRPRFASMTNYSPVPAGGAAAAGNFSGM